MLISEYKLDGTKQQYAAMDALSQTLFDRWPEQAG